MLSPNKKTYPRRFLAEPKQIEPNGKVVTEASKVKKRKRNDEAESGSDEVHVQFWCEYCYLYNRNANLEEDRFI